jgi:hypothetical protein
MAIQIEAPETIRLVEELSRRTGKSAEVVIASAVREQFDRLEDLDSEAQRRAEIYELVQKLAASIKASGVPVADPGELLYGDDGLPR